MDDGGCEGSKTSGTEGTRPVGGRGGGHIDDVGYMLWNRCPAAPPPLAHNVWCRLHVDGVGSERMGRGWAMGEQMNRWVTTRVGNWCMGVKHLSHLPSKKNMTGFEEIEGI